MRENRYHATMFSTLLSGTDAAEHVLAMLKPKVQELDPHLTVVQVGDDPASASYIRQKIKSCEKIGMRSSHRHLPQETAKEELFSVIDELNENQDVSGFIVQLPLPQHLAQYEQEVLHAIDPKKDVDGFGPVNQGLLFLNQEDRALLPATPSGICTLLEHYKIPISGKHAVILGRSTIVGRPLTAMLLNRHATVTVCHSKTVDLPAIAREADILVAAVGKPKFVTADMVKEGACVIDVGIHRTDDGLVGDVDYSAVQEKAGAISPVPGGVGPMTVASLLQNCIVAKERTS